MKGLRLWAKELKLDTMAIYIAYKRKDIKWYVKLLSIIIVGYALSPIDLIPDFIPVLGYLDDLIIIPAGISLVLKLIPKEIIQECRDEAKVKYGDRKPQNRLAGFIIIAIWVIIVLMIVIKTIK